MNIEKSDTKISKLFDKLCATSFDDFEKLIKEKEIDYSTLVGYASWSNEKYQRICLSRNKEVELVLICWMPDQETPIHDHDNQDCQVYFAKGDFLECMYRSSDPQQTNESTIVPEGNVTRMMEDGKMHSLKNISGELAMTLHLYTNPISECKVYSESENSTSKVALSYDLDIQEGQTSVLNELKKFVEISGSLVKDEEEAPISKRILTSELHKELNIELSEKPLDDASFYEITKKVVLATPKTSSKLFFNQLFGGRQPKAVLGDLLAVMLNNSMYTYKVGGVQIGIEMEIINKVIDLIGFGSEAGGTFPTGGSMCNFNAMLMARDAKDTEGRQQGLKGRLIAYTSAESHYSIEKNASFIGIGRENVRKIVADDKGKMNVDVLKETIQTDIANGSIPFFVNATAGTTVIGAFDPFEPIAEICKMYDLWMHIDGAYSGAALFSESYKHLLKGIKDADSFCFNPHKMLGTPMTCSILVVQDKRHLHTSFNNDANYLYQTDGDEYNLGKISFQCGRRNDSLKLWTLWKSVGTKGLSDIVDNQFYLANVAREYVANHPDYTLYSFENSVSICFNYKDWPAREICTRMYEENKLLVGYGMFKEQEFIRLVTVNATNTEEDILHLFDVIESYRDIPVLLEETESVV